MSAWILRGAVLAVLNVVVRIMLGFAIGQWPLSGSSLRWVALAVVVLAAAVWGFVDTRRDRRSGANADLLILWLKAGLFGGILPGVLAWLVDRLPVFDLGDNSLLFELTSGAACTALLIFTPAMIGVGLAHHLESRRERKAVSA